VRREPVETATSTGLLLGNHRQKLNSECKEVFRRMVFTDAETNKEVNSRTKFLVEGQRDSRIEAMHGIWILRMNGIQKVLTEIFQ